MIRIIAALFATMLVAADTDWLLYRGNPTQTGVATGKLPDELGILWTVASEDSIEGAPAVADGVVYFGSMDEYLYAVDLNTGAQKWKQKFGSFKSSPAIRGKRIYIGDADGVFYCINADNGNKVWDFKTGSEIDGGANFADDRILFGSHDEALYCLKLDGTVDWKFKTNGPVNGSPLVSEGYSFVAGCDGAMHVVDLKTGKELRSVELDGPAAATAAGVGDMVYVGTMSNQFKAVDWKKGEVVWTYEPKFRPREFYGSPAVEGDIVVTGSRDKRIHAIHRKTGAAIWSVPTNGKVDSSPVIVGNRVYAGSYDSFLWVLDLETGRQLQKLALDGPVSGSPAVVDGKLLIGTQKGTLYCLGKK